MTRITVPKGTVIVINNRAANTNEEIWGEDALQWKPERWLSPLPKDLMDAHLPGVYSNLFVPSSCSDWSPLRSKQDDFRWRK